MGKRFHALKPIDSSADEIWNGVATAFVSDVGLQRIIMTAVDTIGASRLTTSLAIMMYRFFYRQPRTRRSTNNLDIGR